MRIRILQFIVQILIFIPSMWLQCQCRHYDHFLFQWSRIPSSSYSSGHSTVHNHTAVNEKMPLEFRNLNFKVQFLFHQFVCSCQCGHYDHFLIQWSRKPWSSYSSCHTTMHNLTAVNEQMRVELRQFNVRISILMPSMWPQCRGGHLDHFYISIEQKTMKFWQ